MATERLHGDDTTVPVLAKGKTDTARCWVYGRDDKPFGGTSPPAAIFYYSRDRKDEHPRRHLAGYSGIFQADAFDGYRQLYVPDRDPGRFIEAACWVHARRPFFAMADLDENSRRRAAGNKEIPLSPIAIEIVRRIDALFEIERPINGKTPNERRAVRQSLSKPLVDDLMLYMRDQRAKLARGNDLAKAIDYITKRWDAFTLFLAEGRVCLSNNAAERALRGIAITNKNVSFLGSDAGGERAAVIYTVLQTAKLNGIDPEAYLADVIDRMAKGTRSIGSASFSRGTGNLMSKLPPYLRRLEQELLVIDEDAMLLEELDGFIAGLLVCPELIKPGEWLPAVWGSEDGNEPAFDSLDHLNRVLGLVMEHYNGIARTLVERPDLYAPLFAVDERNNDILWELWIEGKRCFAAILSIRYGI